MAVLFTLLGLIAGALSGLVGIGGGVVIVPALIYLFHFSQKDAQGTTLALLIPPIGLLAAWTYFKAGHVNWWAAIFIIIGFIAGSYLGANYAVHLSGAALSRVFGLFLLALAIKMLVFP